MGTWPLVLMMLRFQPCLDGSELALSQKRATTLLLSYLSWIRCYLICNGSFSRSALVLRILLFAYGNF